MNLLEKIRFGILANSLIGRFFIRRNLDRLLQYRFRNEGTIGEVINTCFDEYLNEHEKNDSSLRLSLTVDIVQCYYRYRAHPKEYFLFGFREMSAKRRSQFLTQRYKDFVMVKYVGLGDKRTFLEDKWRFYNFFKEYFKRDVAKVGCESDFAAFEKFYKKHERFIVKPQNGQCGKGIHVINTSNVDTPKAVFDKLLSTGKYVIEELIQQDDVMKSWNHSSVNTVRVPSFYTKNGFHILKPFLRLGREGSIVDNAATGGLFAVIDEKTGILTTDGYDEFGHKFINHPDSGGAIKGWQIPHWKELLSIVQEIHSKVPDQPYIGWDFALSHKGWVLIEGNWGQFVSEFADKEGIKDKFEKYFGLK